MNKEQIDPNRYLNSSMACSLQNCMLHSIKHFGETNSFGKILREVSAAGWREKAMRFEDQVLSPAGTVSKSHSAQGGT